MFAHPRPLAEPVWRIDVADGKRCARCGDTKPLTEFVPGTKWSDGLFPYCLDCKRASGREGYARHRNRRLADSRDAYARNPEPYKRAAKIRYATKGDEIRRSQAAWNERNRERLRAHKKKWRDANPEKGRLYNAQRRARRVNAPTLPFTLEQLRLRLAFFGHRCWVCRGEANAIDHVKPLSKGGWHALCNLRPICTPCNTRKKDRWPLT